MVEKLKIKKYKEQERSMWGLFMHSFCPNIEGNRLLGVYYPLHLNSSIIFI